MTMVKAYRAVWAVRHAEREDNVNRNWRRLPTARDLQSDNPMLSERGIRQAKECAERYSLNLQKLPEEPFADNASVPRIRTTLTKITENYAGDILLVSHAPAIGAIHEVWENCYITVGQATVSKFVEIEKGKFRLEFTADASHLSEKENLRPF
ncbi:phosphoglycerate mutase family protein [Oesophagostomum dentatum]|uniref:Phosphoglycerate mutase family protein n=1 Tax=Oesophagostomum dentatum TaxID=61180 RepID=A0A0B1SY72_OESDE|nr:phosphoglycerate mutase family protein [Oesophagostomum dentatum]